MQGPAQVLRGQGAGPARAVLAEGAGEEARETRASNQQLQNDIRTEAVQVVTRAADSSEMGNTSAFSPLLLLQVCPLEVFAV